MNYERLKVVAWAAVCAFPFLTGCMTRRINVSLEDPAGTRTISERQRGNSFDYDESCRSSVPFGCLGYGPGRYGGYGSPGAVIRPYNQPGSAYFKQFSVEPQKEAAGPFGVYPFEPGGAAQDSSDAQRLAVKAAELSLKTARQLEELKKKLRERGGAKTRPATSGGSD